jgi:hypothetical protein
MRPVRPAFPALKLTILLAQKTHSVDFGFAFNFLDRFGLLLTT